MAILTIARMGHPILARRADPIGDPGNPMLRRLAADMIDTLAAARGVGLAAPQVEIGLQMVIFSVSGDRSDDGTSQPLTLLLNPEITPLAPEMEDGFEACLSLPGLTGRVPRFHHIYYRGLDLDGKLIEREATGFHARVVQHECDHLWGRLYPSRMADLSSLAYREELARLASQEALE